MKLLAEIICILLMIPWLLAVGVTIGILTTGVNDTCGRDEPGGDK